MKKYLVFYLAIAFALLAFSGCTDTQSGEEVQDKTTGVDIADPSLEESHENEDEPPRPSLREEFGFIDLMDEYATEEERLLMALVSTHIVVDTWQSGNEIDPDKLMGYFLSLCYPPYEEIELCDEDVLHDELTGERVFPADMVEATIQKHFDVNLEHLHSGMYYISDVDAYWCAGLGSIANAKIIHMDTNDNSRTITYELYSDTTYSGTGVLVIEGSGPDYRYLANQYERKPYTPEQEALRAQYVQVQNKMPFEEKVLMGAVCSGIAIRSWDNPEENIPADLLHLYDFLVELGEIEIPADTELDRLWKYPYIDAPTLEAVVLAHFDTTTEFLRSSPLYDEDRDAYRLNPANLSTTCIITGYEYDNDVLTIRFDIYQSDSRDWTGELVVLTDGAGGYVYQSCSSEWIG